MHCYQLSARPQACSLPLVAPVWLLLLLPVPLLLRLLCRSCQQQCRATAARQPQSPTLPKPLRDPRAAHCCCCCCSVACCTCLSSSRAAALARFVQSAV
jgi:hypothetical protein